MPETWKNVADELVEVYFVNGLNLTKFSYLHVSLMYACILILSNHLNFMV